MFYKTQLVTSDPSKFGAMFNIRPKCSTVGRRNGKWSFERILFSAFVW